MEIRHIRYFVAVAEEEHVGRAAERLNIAPSAVSRRIQDLEEELGAPLFERLPRGIRLTPAGREFLDSSRQILDLLTVTRARMRRFASGPSDSLILAHGEALTYMARPLVDQLMALQVRHPGIALELRMMSPDEREVQLLDGRIDAALIHRQPGHARLIETLLIGTARYVAFVAKSTAEGWGGSVPIARLAGTALAIWPRFINPSSYDSLIEKLAAGGYQPTEIIELHDPAAILARVAEGGAVHVGPSGLSPLMSDGVSAVALDDLDLTIENWLMWRRGQVSAVLRNLLDQLAVR